MQLQGEPQQTQIMSHLMTILPPCIFCAFSLDCVRVLTAKSFSVLTGKRTLGWAYIKLIFKRSLYPNALNNTWVLVLFLLAKYPHPVERYRNGVKFTLYLHVSRCDLFCHIWCFELPSGFQFFGTTPIIVAFLESAVLMDTHLSQEHAGLQQTAFWP